jgi:S-adenosylmethionine:tRNA ribosyltransferase-isomerase
MAELTPYSYELPEDRIAQRPVHPPESAKMLVYSRATGSIQHSVFRAIGDFLQPRDHLVFNNTRVIPARLFGRLEDETGYPVEVVLLEEQGQHEWSALGFPMRKIRAATQVFFNEKLRALVLPSPVEDRLRVRFESSGLESVSDLINQHGTMPIPPYIRGGRGDEQDRVDYQSIFAEHAGSVAAPTASLHFTKELVSHLISERGCRVDNLTLHVGAASFQPIIVQGALRPPGEERLNVSRQLLSRLRATRETGGRVVAVGTTVVRALESAVRSEDPDALRGTELFIQPGFPFELVDVLVTNFHQPRTTHLLLVEALVGRSALERIYREALDQGYRFLSYGDGMVVL